MSVAADYSDPILEAMIEHRYGPESVDLNAEQARRVLSLRAGARLLARQIAAHCPPSWERDEALKAIDDACSWGARSIARNEGGPTH